LPLRTVVGLARRDVARKERGSIVAAALALAASAAVDLLEEEAMRMSSVGGA
jgi:hypothetical protein